jgi:hypothetical protein
MARSRKKMEGSQPIHTIRNFLLDDQERISLFPLSRSAAMLRHPEANRCPQIVGKLVRCTRVFVELVGHHPARDPRMIYFVLTFDANGILKKNYMGHEIARYNTHVYRQVPLREALGYAELGHERQI